MNVDLALLKDFEETINTLHPEQGKIPIKVLGFGEISLVFEIVGDKGGNIAYKRIPIFSSENQVQRHVNAYNEYNRLFKEEVHLNMPESAAAWFSGKRKKQITLYCIQEKLIPESIGNHLIHHLSEPEIDTLVLLVLRELKKLWIFNKTNAKHTQIGIDGQISNWSLVDFQQGHYHVDDSSKLIYLDTSTPLYRMNGAEAMEPVLFLKSAPSFLRWLLKLFFLKEVVDRYYDWRKVACDLIANFYKEQLPELVPHLVDVVNKFFESEAAEFKIPPFTVEEIKKYYDGDKQIWVIFQSFRRFDRTLTTKIFRKKYDFYLPDKIKR
jgi:hypothetical protein